jgi:UDP-3-O-[3-hydroxymyristoyl] N-acetylglucosamine deacetylase
MADAQVIGKQWASWSQDEDLPFRFEIAPARRYASHPEEVIQLGDAGYMRGGADGVMVIACIDK